MRFHSQVQKNKLFVFRFDKFQGELVPFCPSYKIFINFFMNKFRIWLEIKTRFRRENTFQHFIFLKLTH